MSQIKKINISEVDGSNNIIWPNGTLILGTDNKLKLYDGVSATGTDLVAGNALISGNNTFTLDVTENASLTLANVSGSQALIQMQNDEPTLLIDSLNGDILLSANDGEEWRFSADGNLNLPHSGKISETPTPNGFPGYAITLQPDGIIDPDQKLLVYPTGGYDYNHLHLTTGNLYNTELYLGNDDLYVKLSNTGNIVVNANDGAGSSAQWTFDTAGNLNAPGNIITSGTGGDITMTGGNITGANVVTANSFVTANLTFIGYTDVLGTNASLLQTDLPLISLSSGVNGSATSIWVEDLGNIGASNIAGIYAPLPGTGTIRAVTGSNNTGVYFWDFDNVGNLTAPGNINANTFVSNAYNVVTAGNLFITSQYGLGVAGTILEDGGTLELIGSGTGLGTTGCVIVGWNSTYGGLSNVAQMYFNPPGSSGNAVLTTGNTAGTSYEWTFDNTGVLTLPDQSGQIGLAGYTNGIDLYNNNGGSGYVRMNYADQSYVWVDPSGVHVQTTGGTWDFNTSGNLTLPSNVASINYANGQSILSGLGGGGSNPAFRVYGTSSGQITANTTVTSTQGATIDYNQGSYYNNTTGLFTAPVAGLYHCYATVRVGSNNGLNQATIQKNSSISGANIIAFWETDTNTGTAVHFSMTGYAKCAVGDTIGLRVVTGNINFDSNDSWGVTYIG